MAVFEGDVGELIAQGGIHRRTWTSGIVAQVAPAIHIGSIPATVETGERVAVARKQRVGQDGGGIGIGK